MKKENVFSLSHFPLRNKQTNSQHTQNRQQKKEWTNCYHVMWVMWAMRTYHKTSSWRPIIISFINAIVRNYNFLFKFRVGNGRQHRIATEKENRKKKRATTKRHHWTRSVIVYGRYGPSTYVPIAFTLEMGNDASPYF